MECIICLDIISPNDHYKLMCCKNTVHIECLNEWVITNISKKDVSKCFICSQENTNIQNIISHYNYNNDEIIHSNNNNSNTNIITIDISNNNNIDQRYIHIHPRTFFIFKLSYIALFATICVGFMYMYVF